MGIDNSLGLSDDEFLKQDLSSIEAEFEAAENDELESEEAEQDTTDELDESEEEQTSDEESDEDANEPGDEDEEVEGQASESNTEPSEDDDTDDEVTDPEGDTPEEDETSDDDSDSESQDTDVEPKDESTDTDGDTQETADIDFEEAYKKITSPFKASKRMMQVDNVDDAIKLMQMGADYHSKMKAIKPNLKIVSMLEKEGLLDEAKLNNLIDLSKKNPAAIASLIQESGIDPLDIDTEKKVEYKPTDYSISDSEFGINQVLNEIKDTDSYQRTLGVIGSDWDTESKNLITKNPNIITIVNDHIQNGVFDKVQGIVDSERALGRLVDVPDVVAYKQAAEFLQYRGDIVGNGKPTEPKSPASVPQTKKAKKKVDKEVITKKRKAAASTKKTNSNKDTTPQEDYLKMTDEEFMAKFGNS